MNKIKVTNKCQFEKLLQELEKNPSLARGFRRGAVPSNFKEQWERIATAVNCLGPPIRTGDGWQKIWRDMKCKVKKKMATNKAESKATGGGAFKQIILSPTDEAVANLLQFEKQIYPKGVVQGVEHTEESLDMLLLDSLEVENIPTISSKEPVQSTSAALLDEPYISTNTSTSAVPTTSKKNRNSFLRKKESPAKRNELLERHSTDQAKILSEISNSIGSLKRNIRELKDVASKKFKLELERSEREKENHAAEMKIKKLDIIIKERQLEMLRES